MQLRLAAGEGERIRRLKLNADCGFESEKLEEMLEEISHIDGVLEETTEVDDVLSWPCSLDLGCVSKSLK